MDVTARITRLRALIDHPRTGLQERAAAERMLARVLARSPGAVGAAVRPARRRVGRHAGLDEVADAVRVDLAAARWTAQRGAGGVDVRDPVRDAPAEVSFSVRVEDGLVLVVDVEGVPSDWIAEHPGGIESERLRELVDAVAAVIDGYAGAPFVRRVRVSGRTLVW